MVTTNNKYWIKGLIDRITGKQVPDSEYTNTKVASGSSTTLSGSDQTLASIVVAAGKSCVISRLYVYGGAATSFTLTYTQTISSGGTDTQTLHYSVVAAGDEEKVASVKNPLLAMLNRSGSSVTITLSVDTATTSTLYQGNIWYITR